MYCGLGIKKINGIARDMARGGRHNEGKRKICEKHVDGEEIGSILQNGKTAT